MVFRSQIFEEKCTQINLRRRKEEIKAEMATLKDSIEQVQKQLMENIKRKQGLAEKIQDTSDRFREEATDLKEELSRIQKRLKDIH